MIDGQIEHVPLADLHPAQLPRPLTRLRQHGRVTVDTDHRAGDPDALGQRGQIGARAAPRIQDGVPLPDIQQVHQLPLVQAAHVGGGGPQHVVGLIGSGHTKSR